MSPPGRELGGFLFCPELGPVNLPDSDLFLRVAVRHLTEEVRERFDLPLLTAQGFEFFTDYASCRRIGYSIGSGVFTAPVFGDTKAPLLVFYPQIPE